MGKARMTVTIDSDLLERLDRLAQRRAVARSALIEGFLAEAITEEELLETTQVQGMFATMGSPAVIEALNGYFVGRSRTNHLIGWGEIVEERPGLLRDAVREAACLSP